MTSPAQKVVGALRAHGHRVEVKGPGTWDAQCPTCESPHLHLRIDGAPDGRALVHCIAECDTATWLARIGLQTRDLYPSGSGRGGGLRLGEFLTAKGIPAEAARACGVYEDRDAAGRWRVGFIYRRGSKAATRYRTSLSHDDKYCFVWQKGARPKREGLVLATWERCRATRYAVGWEGETDFLSGVSADYPCLAWPGAGMVNPATLAEDLREAEVLCLYVCNERDAKAAKFLASFAKLPDGAVQVLVFDCGQYRDGNDAMRADPEGFADFLRARLAAARPLHEVLAEVAPQGEATPATVGPQAAETGLGYFQTDLGNAELFRELYGSHARFVHKLGEWRIWEGRRWAPDLDGAADRLAMDTARERLRRAAAITDPDALKREVAFAIGSQNLTRRQHLLKSAASLDGIAATPDQFDRHPMLLNCTNVTLDLGTGKPRDHDPAEMHTKLAPVAYDAAADCPRFQRFLAEVLPADPDLWVYLQRLVGYLLTGLTDEQQAYFLVGKGSNGKGRLIEVLFGGLGEYARDTPVTTFLERREGGSNDLAALVGARLVTASEANAGQAFDEALLKRVTGGDLITCRFMYREFFSYLPAFKVLFATNDVPRFSSHTYAMRRRVRVINFRRTFYAPHEGKQPVRDDRLKGKLAAELPGILNWALRGCLDWQREGLGMPASVREATEALFEAMDPLADFLQAVCVEHPRAEVETGEVWRLYGEWCEREKRPVAFKRQESFTRSLSQRDGVDIKRRHGGRYLVGLGIRAEGER